MEIDLKITGLDDLIRSVEGAERQMPYMLSRAINSTAFDVRDEWKRSIKEKFVNPVAFVERAPKVDPSRKTRLRASVYIDPRIQNVIEHHQVGGQRLPRDVVNLLRSRGILESNEYTTYNEDYTNARGNITLARWKKMVADVTRGSGQYFLATMGRTKAIWIRKRGRRRGIAPVVFILKRSPQYRRRFNFINDASNVIARRFSINFGRAFDQAIRTAR